MKLDKILEQVLNLIFFFFGKKLTGYRTVIVNTLTAILGFVAIFLTPETYDWLCSVGIALFCDFETSKAFATLMIVIGLLNNILRYFTEMNVVQKYTISGVAPIRLDVRSKLRTVMILSAIGLILLVLKLLI